MGRLIALCVAGILPSGPVAGQVAAQDPVDQGTIVGRVLDANTKQPMEDAEVVILGTTRGDVTDAVGEFVIGDLPEDLYKLRVSFIGYQPFVEANVRVVRNKTTRVEDIELFPAAIEMEEVRVETDLFSEDHTSVVSNYSYSREEIRRAPGAAGDVLRAMETLPGVSTSGGEFSAFSVRGGSPKDNVIYLDNIPIGRVTHFNGGNTEEEEAQGGRFSIFAPGLIEEANFQAGGFSPLYGGKFSSLLDLRLKEGNPETYTIDARADILGVELNYDGPLPGLGGSSLVFNARRQDFTRILELTGQEEFGSPRFTDLIAKTTTQFGPGTKVSVLALYAPEAFDRTEKDVLEGDFDELQIVDGEEEKILLGSTLRVLTSHRSFLEATVYGQRTEGLFDIGRAWPGKRADGREPQEVDDVRSRQVSIFERNRTEFGARSVYTFLPDTDSEFTFGAEATGTDFHEKFELSGPDTLWVYDQDDFRPDPSERFIVLDPERVNVEAEDTRSVVSSFGNVRFSPFRSTSVDIGLRFEYNEFNGNSYWAPRGGLSRQVGRNTTLRAAAGIYHQVPEFRVLVAAPENLSLENEVSYHYILGLTRYLESDLKLTAESYYKEFRDLVVQPDRTSLRRTNQGEGYATGIDLSLIKKLVDRSYGQINYSYSVSKRDDNDGRGEYDSDFSQPHIFSLLLGYEFNQSWSVSGKWRYATGRPKDSFVVHENVFEDPEFIRYSKEITGNNDERLDPFHTLNVRADYRRQIGAVALVGFLDVVNLYNYENVNEERFNELTGETAKRGFRILPTAGLKFEF